MANSKPFTYGGQAVLEGVMMRGRRWATVAVRAPSSEIILHSEPLPKAIYDSWFVKVPFVRGMTMLWDTLVLGMRFLMYSANMALQEEEASRRSSSRKATCGAPSLLRLPFQSRSSSSGPCC